MRVLEVRRHSLVKDHVHLSQAGVDLARRVGAGTGPFDRVVTSQITRTLETAVAMGFAVDEQLAVLTEIEADARAEAGHHERWTWEEPFVTFVGLVALVVSHGLVIEVWQVSGADIPDPDVPPPPGGYTPLNEPKLFDRYPDGSSRFRGRGGDG